MKVETVEPPKLEPVVEEQRIQEENKTVDLEEIQEEEQHRRVMFTSDNWEDCMRESVWFGQKIPQKRRVGRGLHNIQKDPIVAFFEDEVVLAECRSLLI